MLLCLGLALGAGGVALAATGCASAQDARDRQAGFGRPVPTTVTVEVNNRNFASATIWWMARGSRRRLGVVEGNVSETFTIQRFTFTQPVRLEIQLTAGERCVTPEIQTDPGDRLYLEIAPSFGDTPNCAS